ncbi:MAG: serine protease [Acidimicrobiales bacterium]|nr:serine protease [Acidimicrobiales bacterium]
MRIKRLVITAALAAASAVVVAPSPGKAIVGGSNSGANAHPFMASVQSNGGHFCGGSVIASQWVLTAAHCVPDANPSGLSVRVGSNNNTSGGTVISVTEVKVHPSYANGYFDAALLRLASAVPSGVTPITLANAADDNLEAEGTPVTVAGWGDINPLTMGLLSPATLQEAALSVVSDANCGEGAEGSTEALTTVCAEALLKDSCQGDSGGPLFYKSGSQRIQIGVVSHGFLCAIPGFPGAYSEVNNASIRSFISSNAGV